MPDFHQVYACQDRVLNLKNRAVFSRLFQKVPRGTQIDRCVRYDLFANCVNRWVGNLRKQLFEVAEQRLPRFRKHSERNIGSHGGDRLHAVLRHRQDGFLHILVSITERFVQLVSQLLRVLFDFQVRNRKLFQMDQMRVQPLAVRTLRCIAVFNLFIFNQPFLDGIDQKHPSRLKPRLADNLFRLQFQHADFRGKDQVVVVCQIPAAGPQAVPVQHRPDTVSVGEYYRRRAVPGFEHGRIILIEVFFCLAHLPVICPGLRDRHHDSLWKLDPVHHQEFQHIIQHGRV